MQATPSTTRGLATAALAAVAVFPLIVAALNLVQLPDGYDAGRQAVSDLALGRGGWAMAIAFSALGTGTLLVALVIRRTTGRSAVRFALLTLAGLLSFVSAAFHTDRTGAPATVHGQIHNAAGILTFLAMLIAMGTSASRFRREPAWQRLVAPSAVLTCTGIIAFFLVPVLGNAHFGIAQRLLIGAFVGWMLLAAIHARRPVATPRVSEIPDNPQHIPA